MVNKRITKKANMENNKRKHFDSSQLGAEDKAILQEFYERRERFDQYLQARQLHLINCPGCAYPTLTERKAYEICLVCNWEDDGQDDAQADEIWGGPNGNMSLTENRLGIGALLRAKAAEQNAAIVTEPAQVLPILEYHQEVIDRFIDQGIEGPAGAAMFKTKVEQLLKALTGKKVQ